MMRYLSIGSFYEKSFKSSRQFDIFLILFLFITSFWVAYHHLLKAPPGHFYQDQFAPAVMQACGKGFIREKTENTTLSQFLSLKTQSFDCSQLPSSIDATRVNNFQMSERYLFSSVAFIWRILGISWGNVFYLNILLFNLTIIGAYCIFRLGMNAFFATLLSMYLLFSPEHLNYLPHLRDYCVAPFALWFIWILGLLVTKEYSFKKLVMLMIVLGTILGISFGFRGDLLIYFPALFITVLFFTANRTIKLKEKSILLLSFLITFFLITSPIFFPLFGSGSNFAHVTILGLIQPFSLRLGLGQEPLTYTFGAIYDDSYVSAMLADYSQRVLHQPPVRYETPQYEHVGTSFLFDWLINFPADFIIRIAASINKIAFTSWGFLKDFPIKIGPFILIPILSLLSPIIFLIVAAFSNIRLAFFVLFFLVFFAGYPAMQFDPRHFFYLEIINLWCIGFVLQMIWISIRNLKLYNKETLTYLVQRSKIVVPFFATVVCVGLGLLWSLRWYQNYHLQQLFTYYLHAETKSIATKDIPIENKKTLIEISDQNKPGDKYLKIQLAPDCSQKVVNFVLKFPPDASVNASASFWVNQYKNASIFYPIYGASTSFKGIEIASKDRHCINNIAIVAHDPDIKLWPILWLPEDWKNRKLYQQFEENSPVILSSDNNPLKLVDVGVKEKKQEIHRYVPFKNRYSVLVTAPEKFIAKDDIGRVLFVAEGHINYGGLSVGLIDPKTGSWEIVFPFSGKQKFKFYVIPDKSRSYITAVANNLERSGWNSAKIDKFDWTSID